MLVSVQVFLETNTESLEIWVLPQQSQFALLRELSNADANTHLCRLP